MTTTCPACHGRGLIHWHPHWDNGHAPCTKCAGTGKIEDMDMTDAMNSDNSVGEILYQDLRPLTDSEQTMFDCCTSIGMMGCPRLVIDQQSFDLDGGGGPWAPDRAKWYRHQIAIALSRLLSNSTLAPVAEVERLRAERAEARERALLDSNEANRQTLRRINAENTALKADAARYRWLRSRDLTVIYEGGVFAGRTPQNVALNGEDLDDAVDAALRAHEQGGA